jgi:hypothetical protein
MFCLTTLHIPKISTHCKESVMNEDGTMVEEYWQGKTGAM